MTKTELPDRPALYTLDASSGEIDIFVHQKAAPTSTSFDVTRADMSRGYFQIPGEFIPPSADREWGFGGVISEHEAPLPNWLRLTCKLPTSQGDSEKYWGDHRNTVGTLKFLFEYLNASDITADTPYYQMMEVTLRQSRLNELGASIGAEVLPPLRSWVAQNSEQGIEDVIAQTMQQVRAGILNTAIDPDPLIRLLEFPVRTTKEGLVHLDCPGNAAGLDPEHRFNGNIDKGYVLVSHNVDTSVQQLTLLAGLSKLCFLATQDFKKP